jgi:alcohol dehydrogenase class IV
VKNFVFQTPPQIVFGEGVYKQIGEMIKFYKGTKVFIITDPGIVKAGLLDNLKEVIKAAGFECGVYDSVIPEPPVDSVKEATEIVKKEGYDILIGFGGGSSLDVTKVVSVLQTNDDSIDKMVGTGNVKQPGIPKILVPTTAGTGSEVTQVSILSFPEESTKKGMVSPYLFGSAALVDPSFTYGLPPHITANTGMDALIHAIEAFICRKANNISNIYALDAIELIAGNLRTAVHNGQDERARYNMALGSLEAGLAFSNASCAAVHALAYPLGATFHLPHGLSNTVMLKSVMEQNVVSCIDKFAVVAEKMGECTEGLSVREAAFKAVDAMTNLANDVNVPTRLRDVDIPEDAIPQLAKDAFKQERLLSQNPRKLSEKDIEGIYRNAW